MSLLTRLPVEPLRLISYHLFKSSSPPFRSYATENVIPADRKKLYSHTLLLPKSSVPLKHKAPAEVERRLRKRISDDLYQWQAENNDGPSFVLLDGPPYANGNLHMGHALNKILKDIINRYKVLRGFNVRFVPGWDCHGLPIEQKALAAIGKSHTTLDPIHIRRVARQSALDAIDTQKKEMQELGVMADWESTEGTYRTLDHEFEIRQLRLFQNMLGKGLITHRLRPSYYSPASRTALAEAELKYEDNHRSRSVYVEFSVDSHDMSPALSNTWKKTGEEGLGLAIWTTTPWTLASNMAVAVHRDLAYVIAKTENGRVLVIQEDRLGPMQSVLGDLNVLASLRGSDVVGTQYSHTFSSLKSDHRPVIMHADHVSTESGTGLVHMAPAHGQEDYLALVSADSLPSDLRCPIDDDGAFTAELLQWSSDSHSLVGKEVLGSGNNAMVEYLRKRGVLLAEQQVKHRYPYDWKTKTPTIVRATPQWFADITGIKSQALRALETVDFYPPQSRHRLESFVTSRSEWCISRQRSWGVPIPVLFTDEGVPLVTDEALRHCINVLDEKGTDHWWTGPLEDFIPPSHRGSQLNRGTDTLDVWFDSGSAWTLLEPRGPASPPADVCLEGSDQHRGWFQSSLLTRLSEEPQSPPVSKALITHGFIVDQSGRKMSKSDGNGISPTQVIHGEDGKPGLGADTLRIWAASVDYHRDVSIGPSSITQASENLRKWRSVLRFMSGSISGKGHDECEKNLLDRYILHQLTEVEQTVAGAYDQFAFSKALQSINSFTGSTLSSIYFDSQKDVLYCDPEASPRRQAILSTLQEVLKRLLPMMAPIAPYLAQEFYDVLSPQNLSPVFAMPWNPTAMSTMQDKQKMESILALREQILRLIEQCRKEKYLRVPTEADVHLINIPDDLLSLLKLNERIIPGLFTTSRVVLNAAPAASHWSREITLEEHGDLTIFIVPAMHQQCLRCWRHDAEIGNELCNRCESCISRE